MRNLLTGFVKSKATCLQQNLKTEFLSITEIQATSELKVRHLDKNIFSLTVVALTCVACSAEGLTEKQASEIAALTSVNTKDSSLVASSATNGIDQVESFPIEPEEEPDAQEGSDQAPVVPIKTVSVVKEPSIGTAGPKVAVDPSANYSGRNYYE